MPPPEGSFYGGAGFYATLTAAVADLTEHGYDSQERLEFWVRQIRDAALRSLTPPHVLEKALKDTLGATYRAQIERGGILRYHPGVERFTLAQVAPKLRAELDRRILASAGLIKLNRERMVADTIQRFSGWATSIPAGGTEVAKRREVKEQVRRPLASLPFAERRVLIDQGMKLTSALSEILAVDGGALAGHWRSHFAEQNYDYRPRHKHFDVVDHYFIVRDNWAMRAGLMKKGDYRYTDEIEKPGELIYCRCWYEWKYNLRSIPEDMLTEKGRTELARVRIAA
jgi:hypothetical protein